MKKRGYLICCCDQAREGCKVMCPKGKKINPNEVIPIPQWKRKFDKYLMP